MLNLDIRQEEIPTEEMEKLQELRNQCATAIVEMTTVATCGHPGGSLSTLDFLLIAYSTINHDPQNPGLPHRDRLFVSHGHISPGVYSTLASFGYFDLDEAILHFRKAGTVYGGHVEIFAPGVEWNTGNLGQGFSAATGAALAAKLRKEDFRVICCMGDGEQQKGQISEARRFAVKYNLDNLIGYIDVNRLQIGGETARVMPQNIVAEWEASGWNVIEIEDGHDFESLYKSFRQAYLRETPNPDRPTVLVTHTTMGKGISFMEDDAVYHGTAASPEEARQAMAELGSPDRIDELLAKREQLELKPALHEKDPICLDYPQIKTGDPVCYPADKVTDCRSAYGRVLKDLAELNNIEGEVPKVLGFTCDLEGSVRMKDFHQRSPQAFFEAGIQEHNTAVMTGRLSKEGFCVFFSTFGVFGGSEVYNQQRLSDFNQAKVKVVSTHCGLDVGEDGPTHQCLDYIGLFSHFFNFNIFFPADPNQTDHLIRYIAPRQEPCFVGMGRSKIPVITREDGQPYFDTSYQFEPGKADVLRSGNDGAILAFGPAVHNALEAREILLKDGLEVRVVNMASLAPLDKEAILDAAQTKALVTVEDHHLDTGLGSKVANVLADSGVATRFRRMGIHKYGSSGTPDELYEYMGLDGKTISQVVKAMVKDS